jgi:hypothetical protein
VDKHQLLDFTKIDWFHIAIFLLPAVVLAAFFYFGFLFWRPSSRIGLSRTSPHSGSYKGFSWTATVGMKGTYGRYFAYLDDLRTSEGTRVDVPPFGTCAGVHASEATQKLDLAVREWIDNAA